MGFSSSLKTFLGGSAFNLVIYAIIVIMFLIGIFKCVLPVMRNRRMLVRAIASIRQGDDAKRSWQEDAFLGKGALRDHWSEYLNNLFFADGVYHNASNVEDFINEETVIDGPGRAAFSDAIPGLLVSLGFLGTLVGLAQGLSGFSVADTSAAMSSIVTLIPGMRYAFMTSIFGVVGSVGFTLITRVAQGSTERTLREFYGAMSRYAGVRSVDPMTQVAIYQQQQTKLIRQLSEDLAGRLSDNVATAVGQAIEPMNNTLRAFVTVTTKDQMRFLDAVVSRFIDRMDETLSGQIKRLSAAIEDAAAGQETATANTRQSLEATEKLLSSVREVAGVAEEMVRGSEKYLQELRAHLKRTDTISTGMADSLDQLDHVLRQQALYLKTVNGMQAEIVQSTQQMREAIEAMSKRMADNAAAASGDLSRASAELRAAGGELKEIHRSTVGGISAELKRTLDAYQDYVNQFTQRVDYLASGISGALGNLPRAVNDTTNRFLEQIEDMTDSMAQAQHMLDDAVARLYAERRQR